MGQYFQSSEELLRLMRRFLEIASRDRMVGPHLVKADMVVRLICQDPDTVITLHLGDPAAPEGRFATFEMDDTLPVERHKESQATLTQSADYLHRFWHGLENPGIDIVNGVIRASGNYLRALALFPLIRPLFRTYREALEESGLASLVIKDS